MQLKSVTKYLENQSTFNGAIFATIMKARFRVNVQVTNNIVRSEDDAYT